MPIFQYIVFTKKEYFHFRQTIGVILVYNTFSNQGKTVHYFLEHGSSCFTPSV